LNIFDKLSYALKKIKSSDRGSRIRFRKGAWILVPAFSIAMFMPVATPAQALSPVFESTAAAKVTLGSLASRTQCTALDKQGIGPYTMTGTDATSGDSYSYVTDKNYTREQQLYEGQEATTQTLSYSTSTGEAYGGRSGVIRLFSSGTISYANACNGHGTYGSAFGPEIWTEPFPATANQSISFDWAAAGGGDDYEAYGYLVEVSASGNSYDYGSSATSTLVSYGRGQNQGWVTSSGIVPSTGYYRFRFVNGSYDATGGQVLGASMYIDSAISVASANTITFAQPSDIVTSSSNQTFTVSATATSGLSVTFTSSTTGKCTVGSSTDSGGTSTATVTVLASQTGTCTISANSSSNNSYVSAATVSQSFTLLAGATAPTTSGGTSMSGTVEYGETLTAVDGTWGDGGSAVTATTYQWQSCTPSSCTWTNISGATSSTYVVGSGDVAKQIRVAVTKTNSIGSLTANSAASITVPALTSVIVENLSDTSDSGSLRWAITTANASATINTITFAPGNTGTITLTSDLPAITDDVTITGTGMATTIIDGNNLWRAIYNNGARTIVIEDMTFKQGKNVSWNGGLIYNASGTMTFNRIKISNHSSWAFYQGGGGVTTFNNSQFNNNGYAITSDHGGTPTALSLTDTDYSNRIYVNDSTFTSNTYGIRTERFVKINNSQFTGNTQVGAYLGGLNRQQVLNSTFTSNGVGVYFSSYIPTSWPVGAGNQTVSGNTFNGNTTAIQFANNWNNGSSVYNGVSANSFSTASGNTFGTTAQNTNNFSGSGYVESNNTITAAYLNPVTNLTAVANADGSVDLDWDASAASNASIYGYSVSFYDLTVIGGATSGGWGVWTNQGTNYSLSTEMFSGSNPVTTGYGPVRFGIKAMTAGCAGVGTGSCTYGPEVTVDATVLDPTTTATTIPGPVYTDPVDTNPVYTEPINTNPVYIEPIDTVPVYTEPIDTEPVYTEPIDTDPVVVIIPPDDYTFIDIEDNEPITTVILDNILENTFTTDIEADEVGAVLDTLLGAELTDTQFDNVLEAVFTEDVSADVFTEALTTMLDADITSEQLTAVLDSAFSEDTSAENMVSALVSIFDGPLSSGDLDTVMAAVFDEDISVADTMTVLGDLLETNLSMSETEAIFDSVFDGDLSDAETIDLIVDVLADELTSELLNTVLGAVFDEEVSNEVLIETFTAVLGNELDAESVGVIVDVLESDTITNDQVSQVVDLITGQEGGIEAGQSAELSASPKVLESITPDQATEVFAALDVANVTPEQEAQLAEALTNAPNDIKEALEEEVDIYGEGFDDYVAVGSQVDVGARRTLIAATTAVAAITAAGAATGGPGGSGGNSGGGNSNGPSGTNNNVAKKNEEEEMAGEIAGPGDDEDSNFTKNSIFKYYIKEGIEMREFNWLGFGKKLWDITAGLAFTFAGSVVVYYTLSGTTQTIALASTITACVVHYAHQLLKNDED
jgi:hypothetical protein